MLRKIGLENFKGWQKLDMDLAPITFLFGVNSSGKTALLQALLLLKQTANSFDPKQHINFGGGPRDYVDFGSYEDLVYGHDTGKRIGLSLVWDPSSAFRVLEQRIDSDGMSYNIRDREVHSINYNISWHLNSDIAIEVLDYVANLTGHKPYAVKVKHYKGDRYTVELPEPFDAKQLRLGFEDVAEEPVTVGFPKSCYILPDEIVKFDRSLLFSTLFFNHEFESLMDKVSYLGPLRQYPKRYYQWTGEMKSQVVEPDGADTMATLVSSARDNKPLQKETENQLKGLELVDALHVKPTDEKGRFYEVTVEIGGTESALVDVGFGVSQVLPMVAMLLSAPAGSTILLEQPELHLHPKAQSALADLMIDAAEKRELQLIVESHSEHLLRRLQRRIAEPKPEFARPENIKLYFCAPGKAGSTLCEVEVDKYGQIANWPDNFLGDISGDLHKMLKAALGRRHQELVSG